ncbi:hypothetical protein [Larkinella sp. C7]|jgi:hypothetical protein|uniref:hypothetical protein n=1 Tax=Larkinella sp. C7 TaxID=2576607 RepID=UPI00111116F3|nr:hypothetical protein [Larkinella sp. C7]
MDKMAETPKALMGATPTVAMGATKKKNLVVAYLLENMALTMLTEIRPNGRAAKLLVDAASEARRQLMTAHTPDEFAPILTMKNAAVLMARKLAGCEDVETLNTCLHYMEQLNEGKVMIMEDVADPEAYGLKPNR